MTITFGFSKEKEDFNSVTNQFRIEDNNNSVNPITICIGAVCEKGNVVIILSDKYHFEEGSGQQFFDIEPKLRKINDTCYIGYHKSEALFEQLLKLIKKDNAINKTTIFNMPDKIYDLFMLLRNKKAEEDILRESGFLSIKDFHKQQKKCRSYFKKIQDKIDLIKPVFV
jgi:hypothetical protein